MVDADSFKVPSARPNGETFLLTLRGAKHQVDSVARAATPPRTASEIFMVVGQLVKVGGRGELYGVRSTEEDVLDSNFVSLACGPNFQLGPRGNERGDSNSNSLREKDRADRAQNRTC